MFVGWMDMNKINLLRPVANMTAVSILIASLRNKGIYFDDFNLSIYDLVIMIMSFMGLSKMNDFLSRYENYKNGSFEK